MNHTILVVDDNPQVRTLCRTTLELENPGYIVVEASSGREALAAIKETPFDLIILDLSMPDTDGFEFLKAVRVELPKLKIICISGFMGGRMLHSAKLLGATATLDKPFKPDQLLSLVYEVLSEKGPAPSSG
jgi:CheY-like chemotaxis protein